MELLYFIAILTIGAVVGSLSTLIVQAIYRATVKRVTFFEWKTNGGASDGQAC